MATTLFRICGRTRRSIWLDNSKLVAFLGEEPHTPLADAVRTTLRALKVS